MPITLPGDPLPNPKYRWVLPALLALLAVLLAVPFGVVQYHNSVIGANQAEVIDAMREYARLQDEYFAKNKHYASTFEDLGGAWSEVKDASSQHPTLFHGYRFRAFASRAAEPGAKAKNFADSNGHLTGGYALMAVPASYGYTARYTFFISSPGDTLYFHDLGVKTDTVSRAIEQYYVPPGASSMKGK